MIRGRDMKNEILHVRCFGDAQTNNVNNFTLCFDYIRTNSLNRRFRNIN